MFTYIHDSPNLHHISHRNTPPSKTNISKKMKHNSHHLHVIVTVNSFFFFRTFFFFFFLDSSLVQPFFFVCGKENNSRHEMDKARLARWWLYPQRDCREAFQPRVYVRHWLPVKVQAKTKGEI
ncbi:hypothetical protein M431DRAFT_419374 [Trichoderma harzianum CBS 226.95]|uniref:Uncharacterized protein n=1 Tax=Trichoderma harzianum CBS 226.95 TaxID=983964 RepID=A0A2T4AGW5_TRIHA|nr:hypothetical protein M431DRAFT_419374 [Trichoderma harzianum CBS 226.95]PTB56158.1 hypothetical protein M431DRAFT_419374 [Trichoderma harzianum CBS 226.95]